MTRYDYQELYEEMKKNNTEENRIALFNWGMLFDDHSWNGEKYFLHDNTALRPIYQGIGDMNEDGEYDDYELVDVEWTY